MRDLAFPGELIYLSLPVLIRGEEDGAVWRRDGRPAFTVARGVSDLYDLTFPGELIYLSLPVLIRGEKDSATWHRFHGCWSQGKEGGHTDYQH